MRSLCPCIRNTSLAPVWISSAIFQFKNGGSFNSNPVQEISDQDDHALHGPHHNDLHLHGDASLWPQANVVC